MRAPREEARWGAAHKRLRRRIAPQVAVDSVGAGAAMPAIAKTMLELVDVLEERQDTAATTERVIRLLEPVRRLAS
jgi:hypothetical protein